MSISATDVNKLRQMTGAGMMDCKKALTEANGDFETAIDILRKKGQKVSASRSDKEAKEGSVFVKTNDKGNEGIIVALNCETDFVAKNEEFQKLGSMILEVADKNKPASIDELLSLKSGNLSIQEHITDLVGKIGEKVEVSSYERVTGDQVVPYIHGGAKLGVLVALKGVAGGNFTEVGKDVAMQIAAMKPIALDKGDVDPSVVQREIEIGKEQARAEGKAEAMLEKIALGKLNKFYKDNTLLNQEFVKDNSKTISQMLDSVQKGLTVSAFRRISVN
ncbi:translation elongation factor Ts [Sporocytophaga myxococcoides]|uniref:Elongation factor Ts n=1 Tax=Sporocytophaga myxococcoides TaxID=153721 RepID=A0A098L9Q7_9BACT|nr:translation elongation factor Ts [Sporocytophaga myxococcoides]GAL82873.1 translation elongation factor Ts [Sporocytophaga myxococcoides]